MMKIAMGFVLATLTMTSAFANELTLPGERWLAKFTGYVCADGNTQTAAVPAAFAALNVNFGRMTTDYSLDNILLKGTFVDAGTVCNYSALLFADNAAWTLKLVESRAFSADGLSCANGKAALDTLLAFNPYKYLHGRAAVFIPVQDAAAQCGTGATAVGLHFQVQGRL